MIIIDSAVTLLMSPLLLVQAIGVRKRALRLPEADGPRTGSIGEGQPLRILIVGDSSAAGVGAATQSAALAGQLAASLGTHYALEWHLIASTGATTPSTFKRLQNEPLPDVDIVLMILGVNDVTRGGPQRAWLRCHKALRALLRKGSGAQRLYVSEIPPMGEFPLLPHPLRWLLGRRATRFDAALRTALSAENDTFYAPFPDTLDPADMAEDGFHPGPVIYAAWAKEMARRIVSDGPPIQ